MRTLLLLPTFLFLTILSCSEVKSTADVSEAKELNLVFYNVENLFDTEDDPTTADEEFTPSGRKEWTAQRYEKKLDQLGKVINSAGRDMPDIIGLCEVENERVVQDLSKSAYFENTNYALLHKDSPDGRGIDVALLYDPEKIQLEAVNYLESKLPVGDRPNTRLVLHAKGTFAGEALHVFVNHWPSRYGGQKESEPNRLTVAYNVRKEIDRVLEEDPNAKIILMGDFNDHPNNKSLSEVLEAGPQSSDFLVNLMWDKHKRGEGSYNYKGEWGALDQFIVSPGLVDGQGLEVQRATVRFVKHDWMMYVDDQGVAFPSRTYGGPNYYGGFSDHLPIAMQLSVNP